MSAINWTDEQRAVIESVDKNTLVSASAGSGKTAVMLERVMRLVVGDKLACRAPIPLRKIMIVTFNDSVATELKGKINAGLSRLMDSGLYDSEYLREQIEDIPLADISTLHSFCGMIIRSNFEFLDVQPSFSIVDEEEKKTLFSKAAENVIKKYRTNYDYAVDALISYFGGEKQFKETLGRIHSFLEAQLDREKFLKEIALSSYSSDFKNSAIAKAFMNDFMSRCVDLLTEGYDKLSYYEESGMDKRATHISMTLEYLNVLIKCKDVSELTQALFLSPKTPIIPRAKKDDAVDVSVGKEYADYNDRYKDFVKGLKKLFNRPYSENQSEIDRNKSYVEKLVKIVEEVADAYSALKRKDNKMDFADLEYYAVKLLQNDEIADEISRKYDYVCVDEYQDVNSVQEYILNRVSNGKNLFMVGDVKQSIYQFRMTDPDIFLKKYKSYREDSRLGSPHSLNKNYRSGREVIDFVNAVFNNIMTEESGGIDYRKDSQLSLGNADYEEQSDQPVRITSFGRDSCELDAPIGEDGVYSVRDSLALEKDEVYAEGVYIAEKIASLVGRENIQVSSDEGMVYRPVRFSDIAILCPKRSDGVEKIVCALKSAGIPVDSANIVNEKFNPTVSLIVDFIKVLDNHRQDIPLSAILTSKVFAWLSYADLAEIKKRYREEKFFCDAVERYAEEMDDGIAVKLKEFFALLDRYRFASTFMSVSDLIRRISADFDLRSFAIAGYGGESGYIGLERFVSKLEGKPYNSSIFKFAEAAENSPDFGSVACDISVQGDFVKTSTIHASKGLEYPIVFLVDIAKQANMTDVITAPAVYDKRFGFALRNINDMERSYDDSLPMELIKTFKSKDIIEEYMRLFYVAVTRARNKLYLTATTSKEFGNKYVNKPKSMWDWLNNVACKDSDFMDKYYFCPQDDVSEDYGEESVDIARLAVDENRLAKFQDMLDKKYAYGQATRTLVKHTVTSVNNEYYQSRNGQTSIPLEYSESLLEIAKNSDEAEKEEMSASADEGIAYHRVLECIDYDCYTLADVETNIALMVEQGLLSEEQRKAVDINSVFECLQSRTMEQARKYPHYREKQFMLNLPADEILDTQVKDSVLLQGTIDLFIQGRSQGGENLLVDFKFSGKSPEAIKERYRRQLELYAMAIEECLGEKVDKKIIFVLGRNIEITL